MMNHLIANVLISPTSETHIYQWEVTNDVYWKKVAHLRSLPFTIIRLTVLPKCHLLLVLSGWFFYGKMDKEIIKK